MKTDEQGKVARKSIDVQHNEAVVKIIHVKDNLIIVGYRDLCVHLIQINHSSLWDQQQPEEREGDGENEHVEEEVAQDYIILKRFEI